MLPYMLTGVASCDRHRVAGDCGRRNADGGVVSVFWVWDEWNNLNVEHIIIAIFVIGIVGLLLEQMLVAPSQVVHLRRIGSLT